MTNIESPRPPANGIIITAPTWDPLSVTVVDAASGAHMEQYLTNVQINIEPGRPITVTMTALVDSFKVVADKDMSLVLSDEPDVTQTPLQKSALKYPEPLI